MIKFIAPILIFLFSFFASSYNINNFPKMIGDEGIYVAQAHSLVYENKLGPYTYWYDHSPLGWLQIGLWQKLVGINSFWNSSVLTSRILIAILLAGTTTLLYLVVHYLTKSRLIAFSVTLVYSLSALTQTFGRLVLLDNLAIFWLILSLTLLLYSPNRIKWTTLSALALALSILTKESLLFFIPPYYLLMNHITHTLPARRYTFLTSTLTLIFFLSFFPLLAILKGELLPSPNQVSLLETIIFQLTRGSQTPFYAIGSHFREMISVWITIDPFLLFAGAISILIIFIQKNKTNLLVMLFSIFYLLFLIRGGQLYDFYIIPLLPFLALNLGLALSTLPPRLKKIIPAALIISITTYAIFSSSYPWTAIATSTQSQAITYLSKLETPNSLVAPDYTYLDLKLSNPKINVNWYKKADSDPALSDLEPTLSLLDEQFARELASGDLPTLKPKITNFFESKTFGTPLAPGIFNPPYTHEYLTLNEIVKKNDQSNIIFTYSQYQLDPSKKSSPILITKDDFKNSIDLETIINSIKTNAPEAQILVFQDSEGSNTIPWINTNNRSFYKSASEAQLATTTRVSALQQLGFTGAVIAHSNDDDGFLSTIVSSTSPYLTPYVYYDGSNIPTFSTNLVITSHEDYNQVKNSKYPGSIYLLEK